MPSRSTRSRRDKPGASSITKATIAATMALSPCRQQRQAASATSCGKGGVGSHSAMYSDGAADRSSVFRHRSSSKMSPPTNTKAQNGAKTESFRTNDENDFPGGDAIMRSSSSQSDLVNMGPPLERKPADGAMNSMTAIGTSPGIDRTSSWLRTTGSGGLSVESLFSPPRHSNKSSHKHPLFSPRAMESSSSSSSNSSPRKQRGQPSPLKQQNLKRTDSFVADLEGDDFEAEYMDCWPTGSFAEEDEDSNSRDKGNDSSSEHRRLQTSLRRSPLRTGLEAAFGSPNHYYPPPDEAPQPHFEATTRHYTFGYQPISYSVGNRCKQDSTWKAPKEETKEHTNPGALQKRDEREVEDEDPLILAMETPKKPSRRSGDLFRSPPPSSAKHNRSPFFQASSPTFESYGSFDMETPGGMLAATTFTSPFDDSFVTRGVNLENANSVHRENEPNKRSNELPSAAVDQSPMGFIHNFSPLGADNQRSRSVPNKEADKRPSPPIPRRNLSNTAPPAQDQVHATQRTARTSPIEPRRQLYTDSAPATVARRPATTNTMRVELGRQSSTTQRFLDGINHKMHQRTKTAGAGAPASQAPQPRAAPTQQKQPHQQAAYMQPRPSPLSMNSAPVPPPHVLPPPNYPHHYPPPPHYHPYPVMPPGHHHPHHRAVPLPLHHHHQYPHNNQNQHGPPMPVQPRKESPPHQPHGQPHGQAGQTSAPPQPQQQEHKSQAQTVKKSGAPYQQAAIKSKSSAPLSASVVEKKEKESVSSKGKENRSNDKKTDSKDDQSQRRHPCNCKKSKCLKLYCECFSSEIFCDGCNCTDCNNIPSFADVRDKAIKETRAKNPQAFKQRISNTHNVGCKCKRSECLKKYCECFQARVLCTGKCKCSGCMNHAGSQKLIDKRRKMKDTVGAEFAMKEAEKSWKAQAPQRKQQVLPPRRMPIQTPTQSGRAPPGHQLPPMMQGPPGPGGPPHHSGPHYPPPPHHPGHHHGGPPPPSHYLPYMGQVGTHLGYSPMGAHGPHPMTPNYAGHPPPSRQNQDERTSFPPPPPAPTSGPRASNMMTHHAPPASTTKPPATSSNTKPQKHEVAPSQRSHAAHITPVDDKASKKEMVATAPPGSVTGTTRELQKQSEASPVIIKQEELDTIRKGTATDSVNNTIPKTPVAVPTASKTDHVSMKQASPPVHRYDAIEIATRKRPIVEDHPSTSTILGKKVKIEDDGTYHDQQHPSSLSSSSLNFFGPTVAPITKRTALGIFNYLSKHELIRTSLVCKSWRALTVTENKDLACLT